ncbi:hypothetical protein NIE79_002024 [Micromonospora sp. NIE79]|uniref:Tetracyclin repressor-like C-terminal domain-containing protein n=1 Tax=Micromonospora trifolii TaxID=2911208 RepID=A0ABS9N1R1_9ACTN|nr:hypothetical protein [Micromonospora trifolii]MCG5443880.1 hypothetical protein [Micromonospora trifolii]
MSRGGTCPGPPRSRPARHRRGSGEGRGVPGDNAELFCLNALILGGALSAYTSPPPSLLAVYESEPALAVHHVDLRTALRVAIITSLVGMLPRS